MSNFLSSFFHMVGDSLECGVSQKDLDAIIEQQFREHKNIDSIKGDLHQMKELMGYMCMRLNSLSDEQDSPTKIIPLTPNKIQEK